MQRDLPIHLLTDSAGQAHLHALDGVDVGRLMSQAGEAIIYVSHDYVVQYCNDVYLKDLGLPSEAVLGRRPFDYHPNFRQSVFWACIERCQRTRQPASHIGYSTALDRWLLVRVFPVSTGMVALANDATDSVIKQVHLAQQALTDTLTGLPNKLALAQKMEQLMSSQAPFGVILTGLDRFRVINDTVGHASGDMALLEVASLLKINALDEELVYRFANDEFAVLLPDAAQLSQRAHTFIGALSRPITLQGARFVLSATAGCVARPADCFDAERLLKHAGVALHHA